ncbi:MAG TPA: hypothetical protein VG347_05615 [Verrucomicrobiae bacterium]|nr:hypothetical protein [Verrucomicrobiae bacterium]
MDNSSPPAAIAAWLACAAFTLWFLLLVDKSIQRLRGKTPQPPNRQLAAGQVDLHRRVTVLEEWKDNLLQKLDADKTELLAAGERREEKLSAEISGVATRVDRLQSALANIPGELMALLANARHVLSRSPNPPADKN